MDFEDLLAWPKMAFLCGDTGTGGAMLTPSEVILTFGVVSSVPLLAKIDQEMRS